MSLNFIKPLLIPVLASAMLACMAVDKSVDEKSFKRVWPAEPAQPRVIYDRAFSNSESFGINKGFWAWLFEIFTGPDDIQMVRPMAVVSSADDVVYVADPGAKGVHRFDMDDQNYDLIHRKDDEILPSPVGLVIDKNGVVYVADSQLARLFKISPGEEYAVEFKLDEKLLQPTGLAYDQQNEHIIVVDTAKHKVLLFNNQGALVKSFGHRGKENGEFNFPTMVWHHDGKILVTDSLNFRIQTFDADGKFLGKFGQLGDATGFHARPKGVATDQAGRVFVVDSIFHSVQVFDSTGQFLLNIGEQGRAEGQFWLPTGIYIDAMKKIYVADSHNRRVQVFRYIGKDQ